MDIFCGGMCGCSANTSAKLRSSSDDRAGAAGQVMVSGHRYQAPPAPRRHYDEDDEEDDDDDAGPDRRAKRAVGATSPGVADVV